MARFDRVGLEHIPRERNREADRLANEGVDDWLSRRHSLLRMTAVRARRRRGRRRGGDRDGVDDPRQHELEDRIAARVRSGGAATSGRRRSVGAGTSRSPRRGARGDASNRRRHLVRRRDASVVSVHRSAPARVRVTGPALATRRKNSQSGTDTEGVDGDLGAAVRCGGALDDLERLAERDAVAREVQHLPAAVLARRRSVASARRATATRRRGTRSSDWRENVIVAHVDLTQDRLRPRDARDRERRGGSDLIGCHRAGDRPGELVVLHPQPVYPACRGGRCRPAARARLDVGARVGHMPARTPWRPHAPRRPSPRRPA